MKLIVGNWKMHLNLAQISEFFRQLKSSTATAESWIAPQSLHLSYALSEIKKLQLNVKIGAQNCSTHLQGAFTGEISAQALKDLGADFVILGHSERRQLFKEDHGVLNKKVASALAQNLIVIFCVGETLSERENSQTWAVIEEQLTQGLKELNFSPANLIIAYEPVWAIGTGKVASASEAQTVHHKIRQYLEVRYSGHAHQFRLLYGGSVKPENVKELLLQIDIDGALVGGASLKAADFNQLINL